MPRRRSTANAFQTADVNYKGSGGNTISNQSVDAAAQTASVTYESPPGAGTAQIECSTGAIASLQVFRP